MVNATMIIMAEDMKNILVTRDGVIQTIATMTGVITAEATTTLAVIPTMIEDMMKDPAIGMVNIMKEKLAILMNVNGNARR